MKQEIIIVEDFLPNFEIVSETIKRVGFGNHTFMGKEYTGWGSATLPVKALIEQAVGYSVSIVVSHLRLGTSETPLTHYIHADAAGASMACVLYLTEPTCLTGTAFWKHKETGLDRLPVPTPQDVFDKLDKDIQDEEKWDMQTIVRAKKNRAVIFNSDLFHCRYPKLLPIKDQETPRLVNTVFFNPA